MASKAAKHKSRRLIQPLKTTEQHDIHPSSKTVPQIGTAFI